MENLEGKAWELGPFLLDPDLQQLFHQGELVHMPRKAFEILLLLVENSGKVVTKEVILSRIWGNRVVEEANLTQYIHLLRRVLGDNPKQPAYILTIPGKGYRMVGSVRLVSRDRTLTPAGITSVMEEGAAVGVISGQRWWRSAGVVAGAGVVFLVVLLVLYFRLQGGGQGQSVGEPQVSLLATMPGMESYPAFSPDGKFIAFTSDGGALGNSDIYVKMVNEGEVIRLTTDPQPDLQATWSPDGRQLAFLRMSNRLGEKHRLMVMPALGGGERELGLVWGGLDWSPDGLYLAVSDSKGPGHPTGICLIALQKEDGESGRQILTGSGPGFFYDSFPRFSPDGRQIAFLRYGNGISGEICLLDLANRQVRQLTSDRKRILSLQWSPDGREILFVSDRSGNQRLWRIGIESGNVVLVSGIIGEVEHFAISRTGRMLAWTQTLRDTTTQVVSLPAGQTTRGLLPPCSIDSSRADDTPRFSPAGDKIAFISNRTGRPEIWLAGPDCLRQTQLTFSTDTGVGNLRWSPDGSHLAFDRYNNGQVDIFIVKVAGGEIQQMTDHPAADMRPSWSADGRWLYFTSEREDGLQIWKMPIERGAAVRVTQGGGREAVESADGLILYYVRDGELWRKDLRTGGEAPIPELARRQVARYWDLAGQELYFVIMDPQGPPVIRRLDLVTRQIQPVLELSGPLHRWVPGISVSPDRKRIAASYIHYRFGDISVLDGWR